MNDLRAVLALIDTVAPRRNVRNSTSHLRRFRNEIMSTTYWRNTADVYDLYHHRARRHDDCKVKMRGTFQAANLPDKTYDNIFVPDDEGDLTHVIPIFEGCRVIDIVAMGEGDVWACVTGAGTHLGTITGRVYDTLASWLAGEIGIVPLSKSFAA